MLYDNCALLTRSFPLATSLLYIAFPPPLLSTLLNFLLYFFPFSPPSYSLSSIFYTLLCLLFNSNKLIEFIYTIFSAFGRTIRFWLQEDMRVTNILIYSV
jgi:hypothetical protein